MWVREDLFVWELYETSACIANAHGRLSYPTVTRADGWEGQNNGPWLSGGRVAVIVPAPGEPRGVE